MKMSDFDQITEMVHAYFHGLHTGDVEVLKSIFNLETCLMAPNERRSMGQWLSDVVHRPSPLSEGYDYKYKILSIDLVQEQAIVKVSCPLFQYQYVDFLGFLKEKGEWKIVSKMYVDTR